MLLICMFLQFMWRKDFLLDRFYLEKAVDSCLCFPLTLLYSLSFFFFFYWSHFLCVCTVFNAISSNTDELLLIICYCVCLWTVILTVLLFWISFLVLILVLFNNGFPSIGKLWSCCLSCHWLPIKLKTRCLFHHIAYDYSHADLDVLCDPWKDVSREDIVKLSASASAGEFCQKVQVGIDVYIPHCKYQFKPQSSPCFSAACAAVIFHGNHFFRLYQ